MFYSIFVQKININIYIMNFYSNIILKKNNKQKIIFLKFLIT